ncbi:PorP/SprF family type IX secretion system membrane protein [Aquimarina agarilytica]|uniref:PorP/SprF family type IX secretion system membrane protein n=1 Tax=Aquimarina agarilytica TaxID=1087449 RepID=UPI000287EEF4|nr:type IX secretion system membrane protein PorP/SprF [Aquimarina agarilytica]
MKNFKQYIAVSLIFIGYTVIAQQDPQFTQYTINPLAVNSAYAGTRGHATIIGLHRTQWLGIDGAPRTQTLSIDTPIGNRVGLGFSAINDEIGPSEETYLDLNFSYTVPLDENYKLSFGLKGGLRLFNLDFNKGRIQNDGDAAFQQGVDNKIFPTIGAGLFLHSKRKYVGLAAPNFLKVDHFDDSITSFGEVAVERLHLFLIGGWVFPVSQKTLFKPAFLIKHVNGSPISVDVSANFLFFEKLRLGASYRWDDSISGLVGFQISPNLLVSYAYDYTTTELRRYNSGTHELTLRFEIFKNRILKSPRFF